MQAETGVVPYVGFAKQFAGNFHSVGATGPRAGYFPVFLALLGFHGFSGNVRRVEN